MGRWHRWTLVPLLAALPAAGEFLRIEQGFQGLDCASCAASLSRSLRRIPGVESVEIQIDAALLTVVLAEGNRVTLERIRDSLKGIGFTPRGARVLVRGSAVREAGDVRFTVSGLSVSYPLEAESPERNQLRERADQTVVVEADVAATSTPHQLPALRVRAIR